MRPLTASDILKVWEQGFGQPPVERALTMLAAACPERGHADLAALGVGERDTRLFELRELTFGPRLDGFTACPQCQERLEFALDLATLRQRSSMSSVESSAGEEFEFEMDGQAVRFRLPNSGDLAVIGTRDDVNVARRLLAERCLLSSADWNSGAMARLSDEAVTRLSERIGECALEAELMLDFACPSCRYEWQLLFDIATFFWTEIAAQARRLLREVHLLASAYGWREAEVLAMSARRRQAYLEMIA